MVADGEAEQTGKRTASKTSDRHFYGATLERDRNGSEARSWWERQRGREKESKDVFARFAPTRETTGRGGAEAKKRRHTHRNDKVTG